MSKVPVDDTVVQEMATAPNTSTPQSRYHKAWERPPIAEDLAAVARQTAAVLMACAAKADLRLVGPKDGDVAISAREAASVVAACAAGLLERPLPPPPRPNESERVPAFV